MKESEKELMQHVSQLLSNIPKADWPPAAAQVADELPN